MKPSLAQYKINQRNSSYKLRGVVYGGTSAVQIVPTRVESTRALLGLYIPSSHHTTIRME